MDQRDLARFQIDCDRKAEQIQFLESQRTSRDDRLWAWVTNQVQFWDQYTDPQRYNQRRVTVSGRSNWTINQHLMTIERNCP